jgi:hypothetical protein
MAGFDYSTGLTGPGELRFVFGLYDRAGATGPVTTIETGATKQGEVILEYRYPSTLSFPDWASRFHGLSTLSLVDSPEAIPVSTATTDFGVALQAITDLVTESGAQPGAPNNGSSIGQIRTLENIFGTATLSPPWEFRQFQFVPSCTGAACQLAQVQLPQTPPIIANPTNAAIAGTPLTPVEQAVSDFIVDNQDAISRSLHVLPNNMLGGSMLFRPADDQNVWAYPNPVTTGSADWNDLIRHNFAISTCNGCHYQETANVGNSFHIKPRDAGISAQLSPFESTQLDSPDGSSPTYYLAVPDLTDPDHSFRYNESWRRNCEIRRILSGESLAFTTATGHGFSVGPLAPPTRSVTDIAFGTTIPATGPAGPNPVTHLVPGAFHAYDFDGKAGAIVTITMNANPCGSPDTFLNLYGPKDANGSHGLRLTFDDDGVGSCGLDSQIKSFHLPATGNYLIVATSFNQGGTGNYSLQLTCESGVCTP